MISKLSSGRALLVIGLAAYLLLAIVSFPATLAIAWFVPDEIRTANVTGTAWSGHADTIVTPHATLLDTRWSARPLSLITGKMTYKINTTVAGGAIETRLSISPGGSIVLKELTGVVALSSLPSIAPSVTIDGRVGLDFARLKIADQWLIDAEGTLDIIGLTLVNPVAETLGNFEVVFNGADESGLQGLINNLEGPLDVNGTLSLPGDRNWQLNGNIKPTSATSSQVIQGLAFLGSRNSDGSYALTYPPR